MWLSERLSFISLIFLDSSKIRRLNFNPCLQWFCRSLKSMLQSRDILYVLDLCFSFRNISDSEKWINISGYRTLSRFESLNSMWCPKLAILYKLYHLVLRLHGLLNMVNQDMIEIGPVPSKTIHFEKFFGMGYKSESTVFFDDSPRNIKEISKLGVHSKLVSFNIFCAQSDAYRPSRI